MKNKLSAITKIKDEEALEALNDYIFHLLSVAKDHAFERGCKIGRRQAFKEIEEIARQKIIKIEGS